MSCNKYPVTSSIDTSLLTLPTEGSDGDLIGAFVGEECRGTVTLSASGRTELIIYGRTDGESVTLKYHDAAKGVIYTIADTVKL